LAYIEISEVALIGWRKTLYNVSINLETLMSFSPFRIVEQNCDDALQWANRELLHAGLRTMQTFDLSAARAGAHDCLCPYHGTEQCDCQMVILLVYGSDEGPETLILHGNEGKTSLSLAHTMQPVSRLAIQIRNALELKDASS
jgi:hypothetical protein